ncbi:N-terminal domain of NEFA-interacting nuclear protein NIP30-domain-containing protein [Lipomyces chichibuensis]|uniref:N-terminal domain of NEFA-interacting nuclear protein NIP30-domain-containing protein n=1 Tax=Lipomyces chichibuensis TaxID=1546026 RepID=UPI003343B73F
MSSGFVRQTSSSSSPSSASNSVPVSRSRQNGLGLSHPSQQQDDKSLYEILQDNKAKKQAEFEQNVAERNQLHRLDDEEIAFLEGIKERERRRELEVRDEVERGLREFRELRRAKQGATKTETKNPSPSLSSANSMKEDDGENEDRCKNSAGGARISDGLDLGLLQSRFTPASSATKAAEEPKNKKRQLDADGITKEGNDKKLVKSLDKLLARRNDGKSGLFGKSLSSSIVKRKT